jgi:hypothetical protein
MVELVVQRWLRELFSEVELDMQAGMRKVRPWIWPVR